MKKRGFTLVELLSIIIILTVILVFAVPKINNYIVSSKKQAFVNNALNIVRQLEYDNMGFMTFQKAYLKDFELKGINKNDINVENSLVYVQNNEIYMDLVGKGAYEGFYICSVASSAKNVVIQDTACGTSTDGLIYIDFDVDLDGGISNQIFNEKYVSGNYLILQIPTKGELTFTGWKVVNGDSILSGNRIKFGTEATTVKALWKTNPTLTLNLDGGEISQDFQSTYKSGTTLTLAKPTKEGYTFAGWKVVSGNSIISESYLTMGSEDTVIKAKWIIDKVNIRYNLDGGIAGASAPTEGTNGQTITVSNPSKTGYTFAGWDVVGTGASINDTSLTIGTSDVTLTAKWTINTYTITYNLDSGTFENEMPTQAVYGSTIILESPVREGYVFVGWTVSGNNAILSDNNLTIGDGDVTLTVMWVKEITEFAYTGGEQTFIVPTTGYYKFEVWGAQGGVKVYAGSSTTGYGGYSVGTFFSNESSKLYINVGGKGNVTNSAGIKLDGGYNGGGMGYSYSGDSRGGASGGGATHISTISGLLSSLSSYKEKILIVAGGGGGSDQCCSGYSKTPGSGGGYIGVTGSYNGTSGTGGTQSAGGIGSYSGSFGIGGNCTTNDCAGGGGGYYGGSAVIGGGGYGGGGSGYIGNSLLTNKYMYCYNCTTSDVESTKTYTTTCANETPTENCAKIGNGYAKITFISK